jgi:prevent-host-death family protein
MLPKSTPVTIPATTAHRKFGDLIRRVFKGHERFIVEKDGLPVAAIISMDEFRALERERERIERNLAEFEKSAREMGREAQKQGWTEEQMMAELKEDRRAIFKEKYGDLK